MIICMQCYVYIVFKWKIISLSKKHDENRDENKVGWFRKMQVLE